MNDLIVCYHVRCLKANGKGYFLISNLCCQKFNLTFHKGKNIQNFQLQTPFPFGEGLPACRRQGDGAFR